MHTAEPSKPEVARSIVILGEGPDEVYLIEEICRQEGVEDRVQVSYYSRSPKKLNGFLDVLLRDQGFPSVTHLGLTKDANGNPAGAHQSLQDSWVRACRTISDLGLQMPACRLFVFPDNDRPGRIEDLCLEAPQFPPILACASEMYACAASVLEWRIDREKAIVAAYLSMMERTGLQLGRSAGCGCWDLQAPAFNPLREFVRGFTRP